MKGTSPKKRSARSGSGIKWRRTASGRTNSKRNCRFELGEQRTREAVRQAENDYFEQYKQSIGDDAWKEEVKKERANAKAAITRRNEMVPYKDEDALVRPEQCDGEGGRGLAAPFERKVAISSMKSETCSNTPKSF